MFHGILCLSDVIGQLVLEGSGAPTTFASTRRCSATAGTTAGTAATRTTAVSQTSQSEQNLLDGPRLNKSVVLKPNVCVCVSAECEASQTKCRNGHCKPKFWECDGFDDCGDNTDEENCGTFTAARSAAVVP